MTFGVPIFLVGISECLRSLLVQLGLPSQRALRFLRLGVPPYPV